MKTHLLKVVTLSILAAFLGACDKDSTTQPSQNGMLLPNHHPIEKLIAFKQNIQSAQAHPDSRYSETMSADDALWDVENYFNMTYSDPEQYFATTTDHEFTLQLSVNNNQEVLVNDAVALYDQVVEEARQSLIADDHVNKGFVSLAIKETEDTDGGMKITFIGKTGERCTCTPVINSIEGPFGGDDNWYFAAPMGKCDDPDIPSGADKQLQEKLYDLLIGSAPEAQPGHRTIYIDRKHIVFDGQNNPGIYYACDPEHFCISYPSMNSLFQKEKKMITQTIPELYHLYGYQPVSIEIFGIAVENEDCVTHRNEIEYGLPCQVSINEFGEVEDLLQP